MLSPEHNQGFSSTLPPHGHSAQLPQLLQTLAWDTSLSWCLQVRTPATCVLHAVGAVSSRSSSLGAVRSSLDVPASSATLWGQRQRLRTCQLCALYTTNSSSRMHHQLRVGSQDVHTANHKPCSTKYLDPKTAPTPRALSPKFPLVPSNTSLDTSTFAFLPSLTSASQNLCRIYIFLMDGELSPFWNSTVIPNWISMVHL